MRTEAQKIAWHEKPECQHVGNGWYAVKERFETREAADDYAVEFGVPSDGLHIGRNAHGSYSIMIAGSPPPCGTRARWDGQACR